jgi:WSC domain
MPNISNYHEWTVWGRVGSLNEGAGANGSVPLSPNVTSGSQNDVDVSAWGPRGCIADSDNKRVLEGLNISNIPQMNLRNCVILCADHGYSIAGVESGSVCYCDSALRNGGHFSLLSNETCGIPCPGDRTYSSFRSGFLLMACHIAYENCGGSNALTLIALTNLDLPISRAFPVHPVSSSVTIVIVFVLFTLLS